MSVTQFTTKDSGDHQLYVTGAQRGTQAGKPRYDLIPATALTRLANLYARGADLYGDWNWAQGIPTSRVIASMFRHFMQYIMGERDEDHLAALAWGAFALMHYEEMDRHDVFDHYDYTDKGPATMDPDFGERE